MVFFFQAEDGIRDDLVTGVQTCALRIPTAARIMTAAASAAGVAGVVHRLVVGGVIGGSDAGRDDLGLQRLELHRVDEAGLRIAAGGLPAGDDGAGGVVELAADLGVEAET